MPVCLFVCPSGGNRCRADETFRYCGCAHADGIGAGRCDCIWLFCATALCISTSWSYLSTNHNVSVFFKVYVSLESFEDWIWKISTLSIAGG